MPFQEQVGPFDLVDHWWISNFGTSLTEAVLVPSSFGDPFPSGHFLSLPVQDSQIGSCQPLDSKASAGHLGSQE